MNVLKTLLLLALAAHLPLYGQTKYATQINSKIIKSLQIRQEGELFSEPFAALNGDKAIEINFDALNPGYSRYAYKIIFCNADWTPSNLSPVEYLDGFQDDVIEDFATSMSTTTQYTNYRVFFPNEDVRLKLAGNYAVQHQHRHEPEPSTGQFFHSTPQYGHSISTNGPQDLGLAEQPERQRGHRFQADGDPKGNNCL